MNLKEYLEHLPDSDFFSVCELIYAERAEAFINYLPPARSDELALILYEEIDKLPAILIDKILKPRHAILKREMSFPSSNSELIFKNIVRLSIKYNPDLDYLLLMEGVYSHNVTNPDKLSFAIYLSNIKGISFQRFFKEATHTFPFLLPALVNHFKLTAPETAFEFIDKYFDSLNSDDKRLLQPAIRSLLSAYLSLEPFQAEHYRNLLLFLDNTKKTVSDFINRILSSKNMKPISEKIESLKSTGDLSDTEDTSIEKVREVIEDFVEAEDIKESIQIFELEIKVVALSALLKRNSRIEDLGPVFLEYNQQYKERFHLSLNNYKILYNPDEHAVDYNAVVTYFPIDEGTFRDQTMKRKHKNGSRQEEMLQLMNSQ